MTYTEHLLSSLICRVVEGIGDDLGIEFRAGTDDRGRPYNTAAVARASLFKHLDQATGDIQMILARAGSTGADGIRDRLKELLELS